VGESHGSPPRVNCSGVFVTVLSVVELRSLEETAKTNVQCSGFDKCTWFYRNKSRDYFERMTSQHGGVMKVYLKDASGDQRAPINGEIKGLFFMSKVVAGEPQPQSPFGNTRLLVRADVLLDLAPNVYFADYYCLNRKDHYVTLVLTRSGSAADRLCRQRLLEQNIRNRSASPFLFAVGGEVHVSSGVMVELFFTEDLDVAQLLADGNKAQMRYNIPTFGLQGRTTQGGRPKHGLCSTCRTKGSVTTNFTASRPEF